MTKSSEQERHKACLQESTAERTRNGGWSALPQSTGLMNGSPQQRRLSLAALIKSYPFAAPKP